VDLSALLLTDGGLATACGRVVTSGETTWFEPPLPVPLVYFPPGQEPAPRPSGLGVPVVGVDLGRLDRCREKDGATEGWACLTGVWDGRSLTVADQQVPRGEARRAAQWSVPPCAPPDGGWPSSDLDENLDPNVDLHGEEVVTVTMFRPSRSQVVAVIASENPGRTEQRLRDVLGSSLCVVQSRWTGRQVEELRTTLGERHAEWLLYEWGETAAEDGQLTFAAKVVRVLPGLVAFAAGLPDGLLTVDAWLTPAEG